MDVILLLPIELVFEIFSHLDDFDLISVGKVCKYFRHIYFKLINENLIRKNIKRKVDEVQDIYGSQYPYFKHNVLDIYMVNMVKYNKLFYLKNFIERYGKICYWKYDLLLIEACVKKNLKMAKFIMKFINYNNCTIHSYVDCILFRNKNPHNYDSHAIYPDYKTCEYISKHREELLNNIIKNEDIERLFNTKHRYVCI